MKSPLRHIDVSKRLTDRILAGYSALVYLFLYAPILVVVLLAFKRGSVPSFPINELSLRWFQALLPPDYNEEIINALGRSIFLGTISAIGTAIVGTLAALGMVRSDMRILDTGTLNLLFTTPLIVPWIVSGIAILTLYNIIGIAGSFVSLVVGHVLIALPYVVLIVASQLQDFDRSLEEVAQNLGATELRTFYEVTLPLISPGVIAGMLFAFTFSFDNFVQTFFWADLDFQTLPLVIYSQIRFGLSPVINSASTIVLLISITVAIVAEKLSTRYIG